MKKLRFGVVYSAPPFFNPGINEMGYVDISDLNLSPGLFLRLEKWNNEFQETFCDDYPPDSGFKKNDDLLAHNALGAELVDLIRNELGSSVSIEFVPLR